MASQKYTKGQTDSIFETKKTKKLMELFNMLDSDGDGQISA